MYTLSQLRVATPELGQLTDTEIANRVYQRDYASMDRDEFNEAFGYDPAAPTAIVAPWDNIQSLRQSNPEVFQSNGDYSVAQHIYRKKYQEAGVPWEDYLAANGLASSTFGEEAIGRAWDSNMAATQVLVADQLQKANVLPDLQKSLLDDAAQNERELREAYLKLDPNIVDTMTGIGEGTDNVLDVAENFWDVFTEDPIHGLSVSATMFGEQAMNLPMVIAGAAVGTAVGTVAGGAGAGGATGGFGAPIGATVGGVVGGAAGMGASSAMIEYAHSLRESLSSSGIDVTNSDEVLNAIQDPVFMSKAREDAASRGWNVGKWDALGYMATLGIANAGKLALKSAQNAGRTVRGSIAATTGLAATASEMYTGYAGEAAAQDAEGYGDPQYEPDYAARFWEMFLELPGGAVSLTGDALGRGIVAGRARLYNRKGSADVPVAPLVDSEMGPDENTGKKVEVPGQGEGQVLAKLRLSNPIPDPSNKDKLLSSVYSVNTPNGVVFVNPDALGEPGPAIEETPETKVDARSKVNKEAEKTGTPITGRDDEKIAFPDMERPDQMEDMYDVIWQDVVAGGYIDDPTDPEGTDVTNKMIELKELGVIKNRQDFENWMDAYVNNPEPKTWNAMVKKAIKNQERVSAEVEEDADPTDVDVVRLPQAMDALDAGRIKLINTAVKGKTPTKTNLAKLKEAFLGEYPFAGDEDFIEFIKEGKRPARKNVAMPEEDIAEAEQKPYRAIPLLNRQGQKISPEIDGATRRGIDSIAKMTSARYFLINPETNRLQRSMPDGRQIEPAYADKQRAFSLARESYSWLYDAQEGEFFQVVDQENKEAPKKKSKRPPVRSGVKRQGVKNIENVLGKDVVEAKSSKLKYLIRDMTKWENRLFGEDGNPNDKTARSHYNQARRELGLDPIKSYRGRPTTNNAKQISDAYKASEGRRGMPSPNPSLLWSIEDGYMGDVPVTYWAQKTRAGDNTGAIIYPDNGQYTFVRYESLEQRMEFPERTEFNPRKVEASPNVAVFDTLEEAQNFGNLTDNLIEGVFFDNARPMLDIERQLDQFQVPAQGLPGRSWINLLFETSPDENVTFFNKNQARLSGLDVFLQDNENRFLTPTDLLKFIRTTTQDPVLRDDIMSFNKQPVIVRPDAVPSFVDIAKNLERIFKEIAPKVNWAFVPHLPAKSGNVWGDSFTSYGGLYQPGYNPLHNLITMNLNAPRVYDIVFHEVFHYLEEMGFFTDDEWAVITDNMPAIRKLAFEITQRNDTYSMIDSPEWFNSPHRDMEARAIVAGDWYNNRYNAQPATVEQPGLLKRLWDATLGRLFDNVFKYLKGTDIKSVEDIFEEIATGSVGRRRPKGEPNDPAIAMEYAAAGYETGNTNAEFMSWFGDSHVVDEKGAPLRVYHGSRFDNIHEMSPQDNVNPNLQQGRGVYWTDDPSEAGNYATTREGTGSPTVYMGYLSLQNPLYADDYPTSSQKDQLLNMLSDNILIPDEERAAAAVTMDMNNLTFKELMDANPAWSDTVNQWARDNNYDGMIIPFFKPDGSMHNNYVAFHSNSMRWAYNNTTSKQSKKVPQSSTYRAGDVDSFFSEGVIDDVLDQNPESRTTMIHLDPYALMRLLPQNFRLNQDKLNKAKENMQYGELKGIPTIRINKGSDGLARVVSGSNIEELYALAEASAGQVPVKVEGNVRWGSENDHPIQLQSHDRAFEAAWPGAETWIGFQTPNQMTEKKTKTLRPSPQVANEATDIVMGEWEKQMKNGGIPVPKPSHPSGFNSILRKENLNFRKRFNNRRPTKATEEVSWLTKTALTTRTLAKSNPAIAGLQAIIGDFKHFRDHMIAQLSQYLEPVFATGRQSRADLDHVYKIMEYTSFKDTSLKDVKVGTVVPLEDVEPLERLSQADIDKGVLRFENDKQVEIYKTLQNAFRKSLLVAGYGDLFQTAQAWANTLAEDMTFEDKEGNQVGIVFDRTFREFEKWDNDMNKNQFSFKALSQDVKHKIEEMRDVKKFMEKAEFPKYQIERLEGEIERLKDFKERVDNYKDYMQRDYIPRMRFGNYAMSAKVLKIDEDGNPVKDKQGRWIYELRHLETLEGGAYGVQSRAFDPTSSALGVLRKGDLRANELMAKMTARYGHLGEVAYTRGKDRRNESTFENVPNPPAVIITETPFEFNYDWITQQAPDTVLAFKTMDVLSERLTSDQKDEWRKLREAAQKELSKRGHRAHFTRSRKINGYSTDFDRAIAKYVIGTGNFAAHQRYGPLMRDYPRKHAYSVSPELREYLENNVEYVVSGDEDWANVRKMGFYWHLWYNFSSGLLQTMSLPTFVFSRLSQFGGVANTARLMTKNMASDFLMHTKGTMIGSPERGTFIDLYSKRTEDYFKNKPNGLEMLGALRRAENDAVTRPIMTAEAKGLSDTGNPTGLLRNLARKTSAGRSDRVIRALDDAGTMMFNMFEIGSRTAAFMSAYEMARGAKDFAKFHSQVEGQLKNDHLWQNMKKEHPDMNTSQREWAYRFASYMVSDSMGEFGKENRPVYMRGGFRTALFQFQNWPQSMLEQTWRAMFDKSEGVFGADNENRLMAARNLAVLYGTMFAMGGLLGLPMFFGGVGDWLKITENLYALAGGDRQNFENDIFQMVNDLVGSPRMAEGIVYGFGSQLVGADIGRRSTLVDTPLGSILAGGIGVAGGGEVPVTEALGIPGALMQRISSMQTRRKHGATMLDAAIRELPPTAVTNALLPGWWKTEGVKTRNNNVVVPPGDLSFVDLMMRGTGFTPLDVARVRRRDFAQAIEAGRGEYIAKVYRERIIDALTSLIEARRNNDGQKARKYQDEISDILSEVREYNGQEGVPRVRINMDSIRKEAWFNANPGHRRVRNARKDRRLDVIGVGDPYNELID